MYLSYYLQIFLVIHECGWADIQNYFCRISKCKRVYHRQVKKKPKIRIQDSVLFSYFEFIIILLQLYNWRKCILYDENVPDEGDCVLI